MSKEKCMFVVRKLQWILLLLTFVFIWGHSCMPIAESVAESGRITLWLTPFLEVLVGSGNVTDHLVRKLAHFVEFTALGLQLLELRKGKSWRDVGHSAELGFFAAFFDESIQLLSNRGAQIIDVWLDTAGVVTGVFLVYAIDKLANRHALH